MGFFFGGALRQNSFKLKNNLGKLSLCWPANAYTHQFKLYSRSHTFNNLQHKLIYSLWESICRYSNNLIVWWMPVQWSNHNIYYSIWHYAYAYAYASSKMFSLRIMYFFFNVTKTTKNTITKIMCACVHLKSNKNFWLMPLFTFCYFIFVYDLWWCRFLKFPHCCLDLFLVIVVVVFVRVVFFSCFVIIIICKPLDTKMYVD